MVVSDKGSQLTSKHNYVAFPEKEAPDKWGWDEIGAVSARSGTEWRFVPAASQFRNGLAERRVAAMKSTLEHILASSLINHKPTLDYVQMSTLLYRVCNIVNDRPIGLRNHDENTMVPLTVNQLILGKTRTAKPVINSELCPEAYSDSEKYLKELTQAWWNQWKVQALSTLLPFYKGEDSVRHRNLRVGDVVMMIYDSKVAADYRLCRVAEVILSKDGCVRTAHVNYLPNNELHRKMKLGEKFDPAWMQGKEVSVQRLVLLVPVEELEDVAQRGVEVKNDQEEPDPENDQK